MGQILNLMNVRASMRHVPSLSTKQFNFFETLAVSHVGTLSDLFCGAVERFTMKEQSGTYGATVKYLQSVYILHLNKGNFRETI